MHLVLNRFKIKIEQDSRIEATRAFGLSNFRIRIAGKKIKVQSLHWHPSDALHADPDILIESRQY